MTTKMKGLLKGLRYISQIFGEFCFLIPLILKSAMKCWNGFNNCNADEDKEPDMQIGFPTDVKHVAHIGWDGPSVDSPSWVLIYFYHINILLFLSFPFHNFGDIRCGETIIEFPGPVIEVLSCSRKTQALKITCSFLFFPPKGTFPLYFPRC